MNLQKKTTLLVKFFAFSLSFFLFINVAPAIAGVIPTPFPLSADIKSGNFSVDTKDVPNKLPAKAVVRRAVLILPDGEFGTIKSIKITGSKTAGSPTENIFGCANTNVKNGTDLIKACGGPAEIPAGDPSGLGGKFRYQAEGTGFGPNPNVKFEVVLFDDFA
jgi:hypothetical protein